MIKGNSESYVYVNFSNFKEMKNQLKPPEVLFYCFPLTPKPNELIGNKIESENLNWKFIDTFFYHGVIEFAHKVVKFLVLQIEIELNEQFNHNMEFKSVKFRCSKFRRKYLILLTFNLSNCSTFIL